MKELSVVKIGGSILNDAKLSQSFVESVKQLSSPCIIVHGGGNQATELAEKLGVGTVKIDGRRITTQEMLEIVIMVYAGKTNKQVVSMLQQHGVNAIGLSGADGSVMQSVKRPSEPINYGYVGDIQSINTPFLVKFIEMGLTPVLCPLTFDGQQLLNTNADTIAGEVAIRLSQQFDITLVYAFELPGVLEDIHDKSSILTRVTDDNLSTIKMQRIITKGMFPKIDNAMYASRNHVRKVFICHASEIHQPQNGTRICAI